MKIIHDATGIVHLVMYDKLKCNQSMFTVFHKKYDSTSIYSVTRRITNEEYNELLALHYLVQNYLTQKYQK